MLPDIQLAFSDPLAWEARWEQIFAAVDPGPGQSKHVPSLSPAAWSVKQFAALPRMQDPKHRDAVIHSIRAMRKTLCDMQAKITSEAAPFFVGNELQQRWMSASPAKRGEIVLAALVAACTAMTHMHVARFYCGKELRVESHQQNGRLFLDLLEEIMVQNPTGGSPTTPNYISNPMWEAVAVDHQSSHPTICEKLALESLLIDRNFLIGFVIHFALCSILETPLPGLYHTKTGSRPEKLQPRRDLYPAQDRLRKAFGEETAETFGKAMRQLGKGVHAQMKMVYDNGKQECQTCKRPNDTTTKYPRCKRCWDTTGREVLYCSPECQKIDWKAGHKKECGRWLQLEDLTPSAPEKQSPRIGPPLPGFKRPGALLFQVSQLNQLCSDYDYIIMLENDRVYFSFTHPPIRAAFRTCRDKALTTGDRSAVAKLAHFLFFVFKNDPQTQSLGFNFLSAMMGQIKDEFEFPAQDLLRAEIEMEQRTLLDVGRRPPLILEAGVTVAQWEAIPSRWVEVGVVSES